MLVTFVVFEEIGKKGGRVAKISTVWYLFSKQQTSKNLEILFFVVLVAVFIARIETLQIQVANGLLIEYYEPCVLFIYTYISDLLSEFIICRNEIMKCKNFNKSTSFKYRRYMTVVVRW